MCDIVQMMHVGWNGGRRRRAMAEIRFRREAESSGYPQDAERKQVRSEAYPECQPKTRAAFTPEDQRPHKPWDTISMPRPLLGS